MVCRIDLFISIKYHIYTPIVNPNPFHSIAVKTDWDRQITPTFSHPSNMESSEPARIAELPPDG